MSYQNNYQNSNNEYKQFLNKFCLGMTVGIIGSAIGGPYLGIIAGRAAAQFYKG